MAPARRRFSSGKGDKTNARSGASDAGEDRGRRTVKEEARTQEEEQVGPVLKYRLFELLLGSTCRILHLRRRRRHRRPPTHFLLSPASSGMIHTILPIA